MIERERIINELIDKVETTFPEDWSPGLGLTVRDVVRLWLAKRINDREGPA